LRGVLAGAGRASCADEKPAVVRPLCGRQLLEKNVNARREEARGGVHRTEFRACRVKGGVEKVRGFVLVCCGGLADDAPPSRQPQKVAETQKARLPIFLAGAHMEPLGAEAAPKRIGRPVGAAAHPRVHPQRRFGREPRRPRPPRWALAAL
jgi:hypothetical protein